LDIRFLAVGEIGRQFKLKLFFLLGELRDLILHDVLVHVDAFVLLFESGLLIGALLLVCLIYFV